jgi:hypothetical protein
VARRALCSSTSGLPVTRDTAAAVHVNALVLHQLFCRILVEVKTRLSQSGERYFLLDRPHQPVQNSAQHILGSWQSILHQEADLFVKTTFSVDLGAGLGAILFVPTLGRAQR